MPLFVIYGNFHMPQAQQNVDVISICTEFKIAFICICCVDVKELIALLVLPSLLSAPVIKGSRDDDGIKRRASWRPSDVEMMQDCRHLLCTSQYVCQKTLMRVF